MDNNAKNAPLNEGSDSPSNLSSNRIDSKIRIIRFVLLSSVLYFISDAIGRWFLPEQDSAPGLFSMLVWVLCFITGACQFYLWRRISRSICVFGPASILSSRISMSTMTPRQRSHFI